MALRATGTTCSTRSTAVDLSGGRRRALRGRRASEAPLARAAETAAKQGKKTKPSSGLEPETPPYHAIQTATGGSRRQRFPVSSGHFGLLAARTFATRCAPSVP